MIILSLKSNDFEMHFEPKSGILINGGRATSNETNKLRVLNSIKFIFSPKYDTLSEDSLVQLNIGSGIVSATFIVSLDNKDAVYVAMRSTSNLPYINYGLKEKTTDEIPIQRFHELFTSGRPSNEKEHLKTILKDRPDEKNLLKSFCELGANSYQVLDEACELYSDLEATFKFKKVPPKLQKKKEKYQDMAELALIALSSQLRRKKIKHFETFFALTKRVHEIFEKLTFSVYKVHFLVQSFLPTFEEIIFSLIDKDSRAEHLNDVTTIVNAGNQEILWCNVQPFIKFLLKTSLKIALTIILDLKIIFLDNLTELNEVQNLENVAGQIMKSDGRNWEPRCYVEKIIDVCKEHKIYCIMLYDGPVLSKEVNIIDCYGSSGDTFNYRILEDTEMEGVGKIFERLEL